MSTSHPNLKKLKKIRKRNQNQLVKILEANSLPEEFASTFLLTLKCLFLLKCCDCLFRPRQLKILIQVVSFSLLYDVEIVKIGVQGEWATLFETRTHIIQVALNAPDLYNTCITDKRTGKIDSQTNIHAKNLGKIIHLIQKRQK